jgi:hypothetical protein
MRKVVIVVVSVAAFSLIGFGTSVRAEELKFQCTDNEGGFPIIVDTKTRSVLFGEPNMEHGRASISGNSISITLDSDPSFHGHLNRKTGVLTDTRVAAVARKSIDERPLRPLELNIRLARRIRAVRATSE